LEGLKGSICNACTDPIATPALSRTCLNPANWKSLAGFWKVAVSRVMTVTLPPGLRNLRVCRASARPNASGTARSIGGPKPPERETKRPKAEPRATTPAAVAITLLSRMNGRTLKKQLLTKLRKSKDSAGQKIPLGLEKTMLVVPFASIRLIWSRKVIVFMLRTLPSVRATLPLCI
jgi:hypothetical protein